MLTHDLKTRCKAYMHLLKCWIPYNNFTVNCCLSGYRGPTEGIVIRYLDKQINIIRHINFAENILYI